MDLARPTTPILGPQPLPWQHGRNHNTLAAMATVGKGINMSVYRSNVYAVHAHSQPVFEE
jgi:hypothetical protein